MHLLVLEHVTANIERKLVEISFPARQQKLILTDIFGGPNVAEENAECLYDCKDENDFDAKVELEKVG